MKRLPTVVFGEWAELGRDEGMEKGHRQSVDEMLSLALKGQKQFSFIDAGCGNGWVVRQVAKHPECVSATGVDGAKQMIHKAQKSDPLNNYTCADLSSWRPNTPVDIVHAMEVLYYLKDPFSFLKNVYHSWLKTGGLLIFGLDFYKENVVSHSWPEDCGISTMHLHSEDHWLGLLDDAGFSHTMSYRYGSKKGWAGTLIVKGVK